MFKNLIILVVFYISCTKAFTCESPCPKNAVCSGDEKCSCVYGYKDATSELGNLLHCEWQGSTTTKGAPAIETATENNKKFPTDMKSNDFVDDNGELFGDYRYQRDQQENAKNNQQQSNQFSERSNIKFSMENIELIPRTTTELSETIASETTTAANETEMSTRKTFPKFPFEKLSEFQEHFEEQNNEEAEKFTKLLFENVAIPPKVTTEEPQSSTTILFEATTTATFEYKSIESNFEERLDKVVTHVEEHIYSKPGVRRFYTILGAFCTFLAFVFITTVIFDCVKL